MKDHTLTLLDTHRAMIVKVAMIKEYNVFAKHIDKCA